MFVYRVRDNIGVVREGSIQSGTIPLGDIHQLSLNVSRNEVRRFIRRGKDLEIVLADGNIVTLQDFFVSIDGPEHTDLFISSNGEFSQIRISEPTTQFDTARISGAAPGDGFMVFEGGPAVAAVGAGAGGTATAFAPALAAFPAGGAAAAGAGIIGLSALTGGGGGGSAAALLAVPAITFPASDHTLNAENIDDGLHLEGTGNPGDTLTITLDGTEYSVEIDDEGAWELDIPANELPSDGFYRLTLSYTDANDELVDIESLTLTIDTVLPEGEFGEAPISEDGYVNEDEATGSVSIIGTADVGTTVQVTIGNITLYPRLNADGEWTTALTPEQLQSLADGTYTVTLVVEDSAGNIATDTQTLILDRASNITLDTRPPAEDGYVNASEVENGFNLAGVAEVGSTVTVTISGIAFAATVAADGTWTLQVPGGALNSVADGTQTILINSVDAAGNSSSISTNIVFDTGLPAGGFDDPQIAGDGSISGEEAAEGVVLNGSAEEGATVTVTIGDLEAQAIADENGEWTIVLTPEQLAQLEDGTYTVILNVTDDAGNVTTQTTTVVIDQTAGLSLDNDTQGDDGVINSDEVNATIEVSGQSDPGSTITLTIGSFSTSILVDDSGLWTVALTAEQLAALQDGTYTMTVTAIDVIGNVQTETQQVTFDRVATVTVQASVSGDGAINASEAGSDIAITGTAEVGSTIVVTIAGIEQEVVVGASGTWSVTLTSAQLAAMDDGTYTLSVTATDVAGNTATDTRTVTLDRVSNVTLQATPLAGDGVINASESANGFELTGTAEVGATVNVTVAGVTVLATVASNGTWTATFPGGLFNNTTDGTKQVTIRSIDASGNTATVTSTIVFDTTPPSSVELTASTVPDITVNVEGAADGFDISGNSTPGAFIDVTIAGVTQSTVTANDGTWTVSFTAEDVAGLSGSYDVIVTASDNAGNSIATIGGPVVIDTVPNDEPVFGDEARILSDFGPGGAVQYNGMRFTTDSDASYEFTAMASDGSASEILLSSVTGTPGGLQSFTFTSPLPDGTDIFLTSVDNAGNRASTFMTLGTTNDYSTADIQGYEIESVDLRLSGSDTLTITEADLLSLSESSDKLTVMGDETDTIVIQGGVFDRTATMDGVTFNVYTLGDQGGEVYINDDVVNITT
jgi:hypothetical protein